MNSKLAKLISQRRKTVDNLIGADKSAYRYLVQHVYPQIADQAYKGYVRAMIVGNLSDDMVKILRDQGYVVLHEKGMVVTHIEWTDQIVMNSAGRPQRVSPEEFNRLYADSDQTRLCLLP